MRNHATVQSHRSVPAQGLGRLSESTQCCLNIDILYTYHDLKGEIFREIGCPAEENSVQLLAISVSLSVGKILPQGRKA